ncbi:MAG: hypothetical protein GQ564_21215 [Bacteroidales bacterium]|nr:hypothetical protein [Bacteroidales bacterium]
MKKINCLFLFLLLVFGISCSEDESDNTYYGLSIGTTVLISIVDDQGTDLLDPNTPNYFNCSNAKISHLLNGEIIEYNEGHLDFGEGYRIYNSEVRASFDTYMFCVLATCAYRSDSENTNPITYIKWNDTDTDTLQCEYHIEEYSITCTKVWFNGNEVWVSPGTNDEGRQFQIVK